MFVYVSLLGAAPRFRFALLGSFCGVSRLLSCICLLTIFSWGVEGDQIPFAACHRRAGRTGRAVVSSVSLSGLLLRSSPAKTTNYARLIIVINLH